MTTTYWPLESNITQCIRIEAEELSEQVLLAVHESMRLEQRLSGESVGKKADERDLLKHLIETERPIPIIGESGFGKSHIIRWLDAQLKLQKNKNWHIIRIPKNASLRKVLLSLIEGLEGDSFEIVRTKVNEVGDRLKTQELADHLIVFIGHRLAELYDDAEKEKKSIIESGLQPDSETSSRIQRIQRHAKRNGLPALIGDSNYKKNLVGKNKCIYQIAKRLTSGSSLKDLDDNNYQVRIEDLDFSLNIEDLSNDARQYVVSASLTTDLSRQQEATDLLNEVLKDACGIAFSQLFQFHAGGFQELFVDIRKYLYSQGKTLFILVEAMEAISAIEDVLIDSLMQEGIRDGIQELCSLHSAIAVTDAYIGYTRRRNTLATRAKSEWFIDKYLDSEEETYQRIESFCGRYLNAARFGQKALENLSWSNQESHIWESEELEEKQRIECFERSKEGFSLFPYNKLALKALADKYCRPNQDKLEFNPRKILSQILLSILQNFRNDFSKGKFPPIGLEDFVCSTTLASQLSHEITSDLERVKAFVSIWGYGAYELAELPSILSYEIAKEFSLDEFSEVLQKIEPSQIKKVTSPAIPRIPKKNEIETPEDLTESQVDKLKQVARNLDIWFNKKNIPQDEANYLRKVLYKEVSYINDNSNWYGPKRLPDFKRGNYFLIHIPYNKNNVGGCYLQFGSEDIFDNEIKSLPYREFILAVLRKQVMVGIDNDSWEYKEGYDDFCTYINFINYWLPLQIQIVINTEREKTKKIFENHLGIAAAFDPFLSGRTAEEKLNLLVRPANNDKEGLGQSLEESFPKTGIDEWDVHLESLRISWHKEQMQWLDLYSINRHAFEADLIKKELRGLTVSISMETKRCAQALTKSLDKDFQAFDLLGSCSSEELFQVALGRLRELVEKLISEDQFICTDNSFSARKYLNQIKKISENKEKKLYWRTCKALLMVKAGFSESSIKYLSEIDLKDAEEINQCLRRWTEFYKPNIERMKYTNSNIGADKRLENRKLITQYFNDTKTQLQTLIESEQ